MSSRKPIALPLMIGAALLALSLALIGCGASPSTQGEAPSDSTDQAMTDADEIVIPELLEVASGISRSTAESGDTSAAEGFDALAEATDERMTDLECTDVTAIMEDDEKALGDSQAFRGASVQVTLPGNWVFTNLSGLWLFAPDDYTVTGDMQECDKQGREVDLEAQAKSTPTKLAGQGYDVSILDLKTGYSEKGTLCSCLITYQVSAADGDFVLSDLWIESKSYLTVIQIEAKAEDFAAHVNEISQLIGSVRFVAGEEI